MLIFYSGLAQLVEHRTVNPLVAGSSPAPGVSLNPDSIYMRNSDILAGLSLIGHGFWIYKQFFQQPKIKFYVYPEQYDDAKGFNSDIHPVNQLKVIITNIRDIPFYIHRINFLYSKAKRVHQKEILDTYSFDIRQKLIGIKLLKGEQAYFTLSYAEKGTVGNCHRDVINSLDEIEVISSLGSRHRIGSKILRPIIKTVKNFPPPDPILARVNLETGDGFLTQD